MEEQLIKTVRILKVCFLGGWILPVSYIVLGEMEWIPVGGLVGNDVATYWMETLSILLTAILIPFALKLFSIVLTKRIDTYTFPVALGQYQRWSMVRLAILEVVVLLGFTSYYLTMSNTGALCALIGLTATLFCIPGEQKLREELHIAA